MPRKRVPDRLQVWMDARKKFHLSQAQIEMAREIGLNPKKLGKLANHRQEPWKMPLPQFIEYLYHKRYGRDLPTAVTSVEEKFEMEHRKKLAKRARKQTPGEQTGETWEELKLRNQEVNQ
jgi:transcriptional regulator with XRE-family HTH domain